MEKKGSTDHEESMKSPNSVSRRKAHLQKLKSMNLPPSIENIGSFVLGISGGDCAGKK